MTLRECSPFITDFKRLQPVRKFKPDSSKTSAGDVVETMQTVAEDKNTLAFPQKRRFSEEASD